MLQYLFCGDFLCPSVCYSIYSVVIFVSVCMLQYLSSPYTAMAYQPPLHSGPLLHTMAAEVCTFLLSPPSFHTLMLGSPFNHSHKTSWWGQLLKPQTVMSPSSIWSTLGASLSGTLPRSLPDLLTPLKGYSLSPHSCPAMWSVPSERFRY